MSVEIPTDEVLHTPWRRGSVPPAPGVLHLVVAWFLNEPSRTGHAAPLNAPSWLERGMTDLNESAPLFFREMRPGPDQPGARLESTAVSRRQLLFDPEDRSVRVRSIGRRTLLHNGVPATECVSRAGDILMLEDTAVFLVEERSLVPPLRHYPPPAFPFGARSRRHGRREPRRVAPA